jgi:type IX secretion system PorP/SprF family membrane protein
VKKRTLVLKKIFFVLLLAGTACSANAQAKAAYTQYILNNYILNPALTGIENYTDIKLSYRKQWTGIDGAPTTAYVSVQWPSNKDDYSTSATSNAVPGENPRGKQYWRDYTAPDPHHGFGFTASTDKTGYISRWEIAGTYAYHKPISVRTTLAAGFSFGATGTNIDATKITYANGDTYDPAIGTNVSDLRQVKPEVGLGLWLYSARYFAGVSVLNIIPGKAKFTTADKFGTYYTPNYFVTVGYRVGLSDKASLIPSVQLQYWEPQLFGVHFNAKVQYEDKVWLGGSYRYSDLLGGYSAMAGVSISNTFNVSYSYEVATTNRLRTYTGNTHEIMLGFTLGNKYSDSCPRNIF